MSTEEKPPTIIPPSVGPLIPWLQTLGVAILGAFVAAALQLALTMITGGQDPWTHDGVVQLVRAGAAAAIVVILAYLKQSPLARHQWSEDQRAAERDKLEAQGRLPR
jgi:hypothetical protein